MPDDPLDLSPDESERLKQLSDALRGEFAVANDPDNMPKKKALQDLEDLKPEFLEALKHVVKHGTSESLKAKVAMWGYEKLLDDGKAASDPLLDLLDGYEKAKAKANQS